MKKFDIITFGSATRDIFLRAQQFLISGFKFDYIKKKILLPYGLKVDIDDIFLRSGGAGTNTAATFAAQGFKAAYCGVVGKDPEGQAILKDIKEKRIKDDFIMQTSKKPSNISVIFSTPQERTILVYKGASSTLRKPQIPWSKLKNCKWFYLGSLSGKLANIFKDTVDFAKENNIGVMVNPGNAQLKLSQKVLMPILKKVDILLLNQEEAHLLAEDSGLKGKELVERIRSFFPGILVITNGEKTVLVADGKHLYSADPLKVEVLDKTGAGDAFGAGFLSGYIRYEGNIEKSLQLAIANSGACLTSWGAKEGILKKGQEFKKVKVTKR